MRAERQLHELLRPPVCRWLPRHSRRTFANIRHDNELLLLTGRAAFTPNNPFLQEPSFDRSQVSPASDRPPPDERTLRLGKTLRLLQPLLPTLLASPLPQEILSPAISLHLFPSTHPHLPTVTGRVAYHAALWTSPITWGKIPLVGNVHLEILSERMLKLPASVHDKHDTNEKLIVRWRTCGKTKGLGTGGLYKGIAAGQSVDRITAWLGGDEKEGGDKREFDGLFVFEFDEEGRIRDHVIERADVGRDGERAWEMGVGGRVVGLTDWLLGRLGGKGKENEIAGLAIRCREERGQRLRRKRRDSM